MTAGRRRATGSSTMTTSSPRCELPTFTASHYPPPASCCLLPTPFFLPPTTHHSPLTAHRASLTTHHSPRTTHPSPLTPPRTTHRSPLTAHPSPLTPHPSPLTTHRLPQGADDFQRHLPGRMVQDHVLSPRREPYRRRRLHLLWSHGTSRVVGSNA